MSRIEFLSTSCEFAIMCVSQEFIIDYLTSAQVIAWCRQATSHYLSQCWPTSMSPYGVTSPQWVDIFVALDRIACYKNIQAWTNGCLYTDEILNCIFLNENHCIFIQLLLNCVPKGSMNNTNSGDGLESSRWQAITQNNDVHRFIYASSGFSELNRHSFRVYG